MGAVLSGIDPNMSLWSSLVQFPIKTSIFRKGFARLIGGQQSRTARINPVPGVLISLSTAFQPRVLAVQISLQRSRAHTPQHTDSVVSVVLSGLSREPLPIIAWWTRRHVLDQNRTRDLVRKRRVLY
eukprot:sb/3475427/